MSQRFDFHDIARLPLPADNVAIATRRIDAGAVIQDGDRAYSLPDTVMEGHRFAVMPISAGAPLLSWGLPFGYAVDDIAPGQYVCNQSVLDALSTRALDFDLPCRPNFADSIRPYELDEAAFRPADPLERYADARYFQGYRRDARRGVGTRNAIVLLGTTSRTGSFVRQLEQRIKHLAADYPNVDAIVAVAHTEGGSEQPNNLDLLLRTLAGFMVHPNAGAVLAVDYGVEPVTNDMLRAFMQANGYPLDAVLHRFFTLDRGFLPSLDEAERQVREWLPLVDATPRTAESVANLRVALQCGGSDAFSGISGNPLAAWAAREVIRYGGSANLAETDELIGAEAYILQRVRDLDTAHKFLATIARFKERAAWHGHTAEGNPSGGNKYRGLYNIVLKSIGAAMKKNPDVRLDEVLDYAERMTESGYYFMDSPGNDLESIAGQIASGCNLIYFVTGNGSVTNFPFVPTIKIVTTTQRYRLLAHDMDVNAGAYLDGAPMDELGADMFELTLDVASGKRSVGEKAGHAQVQLWRDWRQTDASRLDELLHRPAPSGKGLPVRARDVAAPAVRFNVLHGSGGSSLDKVGLIVPTSLCAAQVAQMAAARLNRMRSDGLQAVARYVTLAHTEGCGNSSGQSEELYVRTMLGYIVHPMVEHCLLLEHGCEKTHNDFMRAQMASMGLDLSRFGWVSIQMDGGIQAALDKTEAWFVQAAASAAPPRRSSGGLEALRLGIAGPGPVTDAMASGLADLTTAVVTAGGAVVAAENAGVLSHPLYRSAALGDQPAMPTLSYGAPLPGSGLHIMETPTAHWVETITGLGASGVDVIVAGVNEHPLQTHPMVPVLQVADAASNLESFASDLDLILSGTPAVWADAILRRIAAIADGSYAPRLYQLGNVDFQITRGLLGVSM